MKLFDGGRAPNPRRVRVFLAEKGLAVPLVPVDMGALEHREQPEASRNQLRRMPVLELDDGLSTGRGSCGKGRPRGCSTQMRQARTLAVRHSSSSLMPGNSSKTPASGSSAWPTCQRPIPAQHVGAFGRHLDAGRLHEIDGDHPGDVGYRIGFTCREFPVR